MFFWLWNFYLHCVTLIPEQRYFYGMKRGYFETTLRALKVVRSPWASSSKQIWIRSFKWGTVHPCRSRGCKNIKGQSQPTSSALSACRAKLAIFFVTSNFDLKYFCSLLTYKNVQYLIWKIWFISVWSLKPKAVVWLLTGFMLGQSTLISYHTEANGCIFFATGVVCALRVLT